MKMLQRNHNSHPIYIAVAKHLQHTFQKYYSLSDSQEIIQKMIPLNSAYFPAYGIFQRKNKKPLQKKTMF